MLPTISIADKVLLSRATTSDLNVPRLDNGKNYLPFQLAGIHYASFNKNTLFGDEPGLGKTIQSIGFMNLKGILKALIVVPTSVCMNWEKEISQWHVGLPSIEIYHPKSFHGRADILIVSHYWFAQKEAVVQIIKKRGKEELLVIDEFHVLKNPKARISKHMFAPNGAINNADYVHALSGTTLENKPIELYHLVKAIAPDVLKGMSHFTFGMKYCAGWKSPWGWDFTGASNLNDLGLKLRASVMVRRTKKQVLKDLPEKLINVVYLESNPKADRLIKKLALYEDLILKGTISYDFQDIAEARKELGVSKVPKGVDYIKTQRRAGHKKIIVFAHHGEAIAGLKEGLAEFNPLVITGSTSIKKRNENVELFQNSPEHGMIIISIRAGGVGLTLTAASYICMFEFDWKPGLNSQCEDRAHRIGQLNCVVVDYLVYADSLDERQLKVVKKKEANNKEFYGDEE